jgi:putative hydrolase of the HAD superfamily
MPELVLVDFDDTLVETAPAFQGAREALFLRLEREGFPRKEAHAVHHEEVEPELLTLFGMGPFRMEPSFRETYMRLCQKMGRLPNSAVAEDCGALGRDFMGHPRVMAGALEALERLAGTFPTILYSQASHPDYQMNRVRDAGVTQVLSEERVLIIPRKTPEAFLEVLTQFGVQDPSTATMVGNSFRSDINPALVAGAGAVLVEPYEMWYYDNVPPVSQDFHRFQTFPEAAEFLLARSGER